MGRRVAFFVWCIVATHTSTARNGDQAATFKYQDDVGKRLGKEAWRVVRLRLGEAPGVISRSTQLPWCLPTWGYVGT